MVFSLFECLSLLSSPPPPPPAPLPLTPLIFPDFFPFFLQKRRVGDLLASYIPEDEALMLRDGR